MFWQQNNKITKNKYIKDILKKDFSQMTLIMSKIYGRIFSKSFWNLFRYQTWYVNKTGNAGDFYKKELSLVMKQIIEVSWTQQISDFIEFLSTKRNILNFQIEIYSLLMPKTVFYLPLNINTWHLFTYNTALYEKRNGVQNTIFWCDRIYHFLKNSPKSSPYYTGIIQKLIINCIDSNLTDIP